MNRPASLPFLVMLGVATSCSGGDSGASGHDAGADTSSAGSGGSAGAAGTGGAAGSSSAGSAGQASGTGGAIGSSGTAGQASSGGTPWWDDSVTQWKPMPWAPDGCDARYAVDAALAAPPLKWKDCGSALAGCEKLDPTWPADATFASLLASVAPATSGGYFIAASYYTIRASGVLQKRYALYDAAGSTVAALASAGNCSLNGHYVAGDQLCLAIVDHRTSTGSGTSYFGCGTGIEPVTLPQPTTSIGVDLPEGTFSGDILALDTISPKIVEVLDVPAKQFFNLVSPVQGGDLYFPFAVGTNVLVRATTAPEHEVAELWKRPDTTVALIDPPASRTVAAVGSDGKSLVWIEADIPYDSQGQYPHGYLYTAPFVETPSAVKPTLIRDLPDHVHSYMLATAGDGYYLIRQASDSLELYRISDGHHWTITAPGSLVPVSVIAVDSTYAFYGASTPGIAQPKIIVRQRLDALGPGD